MKQYKSDARYKLYSQGFHYIVEFRWHNQEDRVLFSNLITVFKEMYGPDKEKVLYDEAGNFVPHWKINDTWRCEQNRSAKRRRIYLKEESILSLALLRIG